MSESVCEFPRSRKACFCIKAGDELGQAQLKLGFDFNFILCRFGTIVLVLDSIGWIDLVL